MAQPQIITESWFLEGRPWVLANLVSFDRQAYVDAILKQHHYLPEAFRIWILEWPTKAVIGGIWPGMPDIIRDVVGCIGHGRYGWNLMKWAKPIVCTVKHINDDSNVDGEDDDDELVEPLPGLPIFHEQGTYGIWMLLDSGRYRDQVLSAVDGDEFHASDGLPRLDATYSSFGSCSLQVSLPEKYRMNFVAWSANQKPYLRPSE